MRYVIICGCGFPNGKRIFESAAEMLERMFPNHHAIITVPESPMFNAPEAAAGTEPRLELARQAGKQYAESGAIDGKLPEETGSPMSPEEQYVKIVNGN